VGGVCGMHGRGAKVYRILVGKPKGKRPFRRPRHRWENGIKTDLREIDGGSGFTWHGIGTVSGLM
jgi:hypothetical protein